MRCNNSTDLSIRRISIRRKSSGYPNTWTRKIDVDIYVSKETGPFKSVLIENDASGAREVITFSTLEQPCKIVSKSYSVQSFQKNVSTETYTACTSENPLITFDVNEMQFLRIRYDDRDNAIEFKYSSECCQVFHDTKTGVVLIKVNILPTPPQRYCQPGDCTVFTK